MQLINCEIILMLNWSKKCFLVAGTSANQEPIFTITDTKLLRSCRNFINPR